MQSRIMYIEYKGDGISRTGRIGRVTFSKTGKSVYYAGQRFETQAGQGFKSNFFDVETREACWITGCKKNGGDRLYPGDIEIDEDVLEEYWTQIRGQPENSRQRLIRCKGKYGGK